MKDKKDSNVVLYCVYSILYANDLSCNMIQDLERFVKCKDKETRKIYGALIKRVKKYKSMLYEIMGDAVGFFADYNENMDDINDENLTKFRTSIINFYKEQGFDDYEFLGYIEAAHTSLVFSNNVRNVVLDVAKQHEVDVKRLYIYNLLELKKVMDDLSHWCYRHVRKTLVEEINLFQDKGILENFAQMNENLLNYDNFEKCYTKTVNERNGLQGTSDNTLTSTNDA